MNINKEDVVPINGTVYVVDDAPVEKTSGGIIMPDNIKNEGITVGTIIAVSPFLLEDGTYKDPPVSVGHRIMYGQHAGVGCVWKNEGSKQQYRMVKWNEILAIVKK